ncbi:putative lipoprotein [Leptospira broomii serovar Hurstbridge str. 5399]|uniref:Lipoprotein n=1 Tax=Leptospira broomii serovar Hurstbridge str. 5399 TaxID=1049789 RepID=T0F723_9LEPT|nr:putative lipoprotein [Leptospira broomii serovar Hurstbridge str. 5399]
MRLILIIFSIFMLFSSCLYEKGYIQRIQIDPTTSDNPDEKKFNQSNRESYKKCMYTFIVLIWYNRPFPSSWNDIIFDPESDGHRSIKLKNATMSIHAIDFFPPWTIFMTIIPFPTVPIMRICGIVEGENL